MHKSKFNRALALAAALGSVASVGLITGSASADLGTGNTISATSGTASSTFSLGVTSPSNACQGDTATGNYKWSQFIAAASVDPATITLTSATISAPGGFAERLYSTTGSPQSNKNTAVTTGQIVGTSTLNFQTNSVPGNGAYNVGFVCTLAGATTRHWVTPITVTNWVSSTNFNWAFGSAPGAVPGLTASGSTADGGTITGSFSPVTATPAVSGYTVTATPVGGGAPVTTSVPAAGPYTFSLTVPNSPPLYDVTVSATNSIGTGPVGSVLGVPVAPAQIAEPRSRHAGRRSWPRRMVTVARHDRRRTPSTGSPAVWCDLGQPSRSASPRSAQRSDRFGDRACWYQHARRDRCRQATSYTGLGGRRTTPTAQVTERRHRHRSTASRTARRVIVQDITVTRPAGALVLTQRCGVYGSAIAYSDNVFGSLPLLTCHARRMPIRTTTTAPPADATDDFYDTLPGGSAPKNDSAPVQPQCWCDHR